ncbi:cytochrome b [Salinicola avicenniae]|uniref:cytochrome b n=1 Tax=Salinicola avicenniae TaxID=2916836 RepID=UPI0020734F64|nr:MULTISPECIES: cytochrome b [unclassified Salinicola]
MWGNSRNGWGWVSIVIHWLSALAIFGLFGLGWWMTGLGYYDTWYHLAPWWHKSVGVLVLLISVLRVVWRLLQPTPAAHGSALERSAAHVGHGLIYALLFVTLLSGYLISTAEGEGIAVFDFFTAPALIEGLPHQAVLAGEVHRYAAWALVILAVGHGLAACKHHWIDRQDTLMRMLRSRPAGRR